MRQLLSSPDPISFNRAADLKEVALTQQPGAPGEHHHAMALHPLPQFQHISTVTLQYIALHCNTLQRSS